MKLNLQGKPLKGFVNHDGLYPLPYPDGTAEALTCIHGLPRVPRAEADAVLSDWVRVLSPGGVLSLELPCLDKIIGIFNAAIDAGQELPEHLTLWGLYGDPNHSAPPMKWCYSKQEVSDMLRLHGLLVTEAEPMFGQKLRDMRIEARKLL